MAAGGGKLKILHFLMFLVFCLVEKLLLAELCHPERSNFLPSDYVKCVESSVERSSLNRPARRSNSA